MKLHELFEATDTTSVESDFIKSIKTHVDSIARLIFGKHAGPVKDIKRSKEAKFYGVSHGKSLLSDPNGKHVYLTFDNSTDSGEFEINSLVPMLIEKGSKEDRKIISFYKRYGIHSKKKTNYIAHGDKIVMREIHLGTDIDSNTVKFVRSLLKVLNGEDDLEDDKVNPESKDNSQDLEKKEKSDDLEKTK